MQPSKPEVKNVQVPGNAADPMSKPLVDPRSLPPVTATLAWALGQKIDMHVYLSTSPNGDVFSRQWTSGWRPDQDKDLPNFVWENLTFGDYTATRVAEFNVNFPEVSVFPRSIDQGQFDL